MTHFELGSITAEKHSWHRFMARKGTPELTRKAIKRAYEAGEGSYRHLADRFNVSESTVKRICRGVTTPAQNPAIPIVADAIASGSTVKVGDLDLTEYLKNGIKDLTDDMKSVEPRSREGIAGAALKYMQFYAQLNPPTIEDMVDQLLARPDFDPEAFVKILKSRYAAKAG